MTRYIENIPIFLNIATRHIAKIHIFSTIRYDISISKTIAYIDISNHHYHLWNFLGAKVRRNESSSYPFYRSDWIGSALIQRRSWHLDVRAVYWQKDKNDRNI